MGRGPYRMIACKSGDQVRLWSRNGRDWSKEFVAVADALKTLTPAPLVRSGYLALSRNAANQS
jgi:ATP-dependent DNA ligase